MSDKRVLLEAWLTEERYVERFGCRPDTTWKLAVFLGNNAQQNRSFLRPGILKVEWESWHSRGAIAIHRHEIFLESSYGRRKIGGAPQNDSLIARNRACLARHGIFECAQTARRLHEN